MNEFNDFLKEKYNSFKKNHNFANLFDFTKYFFELYTNAFLKLASELKWCYRHFERFYKKQNGRQPLLNRKIHFNGKYTI